MNCDEFIERFHRSLDERSSPAQDRLLRQHALRCDHCAADLRRWQQIDSVLQPTAAAVSDSPSPHASVKPQRRYLAAIASMAAGLVIAIVMMDRPGGSLPLAQLPDGSMQSNTTVGAASAVAALNQSGMVDPAAWWHGMQTTDWLGQTMPAVKSVQEGVAPLGRSLRQAVTILTTRGSDSTS